MLKQRRKMQIPPQRKGTFKMPHYLMQHFAVSGIMNPELSATLEKFHDIAMYLDAALDESAEKTVALRKLLESRDAAIRAELVDLNNAERDRALKDAAKNLFPSAGTRDDG